MKIIDLYNKIANGEEVPEKIQVYNDMFIFNHSSMEYEHEKTRTDLLSIYNGYILNYEVAIIEEDEKIEYIECYFKNGEHYIEDSCFRVQPLEDLELNQNEIVIIDKINEIIDKINKLETK